MNRNLAKMTLAASMAAALMAGCGGGGGGGVDPAFANNPPPVPSDIAQSTASVYAYVLALIGRGENTDPVDINGVTLAKDEMEDPIPLN